MTNSKLEKHEWNLNKVDLRKTADLAHENSEVHKRRRRWALKGQKGIRDYG